MWYELFVNTRHNPDVFGVPPRRSRTLSRIVLSTYAELHSPCLSRVLLHLGLNSFVIACTNCPSCEPTTQARSARRGTPRIDEGAEKMRILLLCQYYPPELALVWPHELARELVRRGHEVTSLTAMPNRGQPQIFEGYRRKIFHCEQMDGVRVVRSWIYATTSKNFFPRAMNFGSFCGSSLIAGLFHAAAPDVIYAVLPRCRWG